MRSDEPMNTQEHGVDWFSNISATVKVAVMWLITFFSTTSAEKWAVYLSIAYTIIMIVKAVWPDAFTRKSKRKRAP